MIASCLVLTTLSTSVDEFAEMLTQRRGTDLDAWITAMCSDDLLTPHTPPPTSSPTHQSRADSLGRVATGA